MDAFGFDPPAWRLAARSSGAVLEQPKAQIEVTPGFRGKVAMVTGGATGLGRSAALEFGRLGCSVAFCFVDLPGRDIRETALLTETAISAMGVGVYADCCNVRDRAQVERFVEAVRRKFQTIHYLINNAGIVDEVVDRLELPPHRLDESLHLRPVADVAAVGVDADAHCGDRGLGEQRRLPDVPPGEVDEAEGDVARSEEHTSE